MSTDPIHRRPGPRGDFLPGDSRLGPASAWLRLAPAVTLVWTALALTRSSVPGLAALVPFAVAGLVLPVHPFDSAVAPLRRRLGAPDVPVSGPSRRFAALLVALLLESATWALAAGQPGLAQTLGGAVIIATGCEAITGNCPASWPFGVLFGRVARTENASTRCS